MTKANSIKILFLIISINMYAQPGWYPAKLYFNLTERTDKKIDISVDNITNKNVRFLSDDEGAIIKYDSIKRAFSYSTRKGLELRSFAIVYHNDTTFIDFPAIERMSVFIKSPIPLDGNNYSFYDVKTLDIMLANRIYDNNNIFYLNSGWQISTYRMKEENEVRLRNCIKNWYQIKIKK